MENSSINNIGIWTATTTGNITWDSPPQVLTLTQRFANHLTENPLLKEGFKAMFSSYFREEFVRETKSVKEITNEDLRRIADQAAEKFTDYLCKL
mgnify:CR=1 FL=1